MPPSGGHEGRPYSSVNGDYFFRGCLQQKDRTACLSDRPRVSLTRLRVSLLTRLRRSGTSITSSPYRRRFCDRYSLSNLRFNGPRADPTKSGLGVRQVQPFGSIGSVRYSVLTCPQPRLFCRVLVLFVECGVEGVPG